MKQFTLNKICQECSHAEFTVIRSKQCFTCTKMDYYFGSIEDYITMMETRTREEAPLFDIAKELCDNPKMQTLVKLKNINC